jgi:hypothetical protein
MFRSKLIVPVLSIACLFAAQAVVPTVAMAASPIRVIVATPIAGSRLVHLNLVNSTASTMDVKVGETAVTLAAGETVKVTAPVGTKITFAGESATHATGSLLAEVSSGLSDATIRIN